MATRHEEPILLTVRQTAALLQIGINRAYEMCRAGELPSLRFGKKVRISRVALEQWIAQVSEGGVGDA